ncbi:diguanylate cyclase [Vibrio sp. NTOU-M3]|uniref:sensor domain-containing diguanylate cyclase n=1 Tax=Vibrio sp. NTOU-M3 TaxID=3234954 RepID=UPI00349FBB8B
MYLIFNKKFLLPLAAFVFTMIVTMFFVFFSYSAQQRYLTSLLDNLAQRQVQTLQEYVEHDLSYIGSGANFFYATFPEDWDQFDVFAKRLIDGSDTLIGLQWMQKVEKQDLDAHIEEVRKTFPSFEIYTIPKDGPKTMGYIMQDDQPIFVASDIYPRTKANLDLLGFYSSRVRFQLVLDAMRITHKPNVSDKVRLLQDGLDQSLKKEGMLVYHPVFDLFDDQQMIGVVVGVIRTTRYFEQLMVRTATEQRLLVKVTDLGFDAEDDPILFQSPEWNAIEGMGSVKKVVLPNREWMVEFKLEKSTSSIERMVLKGVAIAGLVIALLVSYIVFMMVRAKEQLSVLLDERTKELQFLVSHDALTGLYNRRAFNSALADYIARGRKFTLIGFDIDNFKLINDEHGHVAGDEMLIHVSKVINNRLKRGDMFVRMGGDEFSILTEVVNPILLKEYLEEIRIAVEQSEYQFAEHQISCTLSIGAVVRDNHNEESLIQAADSQLYLSKKAGRNCCSIAD